MLNDDTQIYIFCAPIEWKSWLRGEGGSRIRNTNRIQMEKTGKIRKTQYSCPVTARNVTFCQKRFD